jgi:hypothetical protein
MAALVDIYTRACRGQVSSTELTYFAYLSNVVEFQLTELNSSFHAFISLDYCLILAGLLVNYTILRNYASVNPLAHVLEDRFWNHLDNLETQNINLPPPLKLWLVFTGSIISVRIPDKYEERTISITSKMMQDGKIPMDFSYAVASFNRFIWSEPVQRVAFHAMWARAVARTMTVTTHNQRDAQHMFYTNNDQNLG